MVKNKPLGRGLSALISDSMDEMTKTTIAIDLIEAGEFQPRKYFDSKNLEELSESIKKTGVISPIIVRQVGDKYQIIAGERRWRASKMAGLESIPVIIRDMSDQEALEIAIIENVQRQDLTPIEEAEGLQKLIEEFSYTQEQLANTIGKSRSHISNLLRLLTLSEEVKLLVNEGKLSMGHARALVSAKNPEELAQKIIIGGLNVRQTEQMIAMQNQQKLQHYSSKNVPQFFQEKNSDIIAIEDATTKNLGLKVKIEEFREGGKVEIYYNNLAELDLVLQILNSRHEIH